MTAGGPLEKSLSYRDAVTGDLEGPLHKLKGNPSHPVPHTRLIWIARPSNNPAHIGSIVSPSMRTRCTSRSVGCTTPPVSQDTVSATTSAPGTLQNLEN